MIYLGLSLAVLVLVWLIQIWDTHQKRSQAVTAIEARRRIREGKP